MEKYTSINRIMKELLDEQETVRFAIIRNKRNQRCDDYTYYVAVQQALTKISQKNYQSYKEGQITRDEYDYEDQKNKLLQFICSVQLEIIDYEREIELIEQELEKLGQLDMDDEVMEHINYLKQKRETNKKAIQEKNLEMEELNSKFYGLEEAAIPKEGINK